MKRRKRQHYAVVFSVSALIASVLGFRGIAGMSAQIGWVFAVIAVIFLVVAWLGGRGAMAIPCARRRTASAT